MPLQAITLSESEWIPQRAEFLKDWQKLVIDKKYADGNCDQVE